MPQVFIPATMRQLTDGRQVIEASGTNVREVLEDIERRFPGITSHLCQDDAIRPELSLVIDSSVSTLGLRHAVQADTEIHFLPAVGGG